MTNEYIYLPAFETGSEARAAIGRWIDSDHFDRPRSTHGARTLVEVHEKAGDIRPAA